MNTLKAMRKIARTEDSQYTLEELCVKYEESNLFPSYLAMAYIKLQGIIYTAIAPYESFDKDDIDSMALEKLNYCLQNYDPKHGATFTTYFYAIFDASLKTHYQSLMRDKRILNTFHRVSLDYLHEEYSYEIGDVQDEPMEKLLDELVAVCELDEREHMLCKLLVSGYTQKEVAQMFKLSQSMVAHIKVQIQKKMINVEYLVNIAI